MRQVDLDRIRGARIGLVFAFAGVTLSWLTGNGRWDGAGSLAIGLLLATAAAILAVEMKSLLIGEAASAEMQRMVIAALEDGPAVSRVIHMRTVHMSLESILILIICVLLMGYLLYALLMPEKF